MPYRFELLLAEFNESVLPPGSPQKGSAGFSTAVADYLKAQFKGFQGDAEIVIGKDQISVKWEPREKDVSPFDAALQKIAEGEIEPAILMLELLQREKPADLDILFNLGMAYSDVGRLDESIRLLIQAVEADPGLTNARIALGVAYARKFDLESALTELQQAVLDDPTNPWAHRNLAGVFDKLGRSKESVFHFRRSIEFNPQDQQAHFGLADILLREGDLIEAQAAYQQVISIDSTNRYAERARQAISEIGEEAFRNRSVSNLRQDAVFYCLAALQKFDGMPLDDIKKITYEIAILGTKGLDINDAEQKYTLKSMSGRFSGTHLMSFLFVGFKMIAPEETYPFDLTLEYQTALEIHEKRKRGNG